MLKPKVLPKILEQANTNGVRSTTLLNKEGALLATSGEDGKVVAAIFSNIWATYALRPNLEYLLCECENGRIVMTQVTKELYLCLYGNETAQFGMLKHKAKALKDYLSEPLKKIDT
uniref:Roadblock/LAMTOR2 domain-containing protein n=1 Tax=Arcella intermedia TaxID=1963864 RepID=A0A6B2LSQ5_9EUKA|eukprot:TRINITY_DN4664_c0_g1_i1.p1 TRINITY_DN4664_c0_g1~~TRINITY_DN4664_c0_g1_i1.p1  ORF type:complete len:123 (-),score=27.24 TRINITY_DN4664_c0_g1_i1:54-401(-)